MKKLINIGTKEFVKSNQLNLKNTLLNGQCFNWQRDLLDNEDQTKNHFVGVFKNTFIKLQENEEDNIIYFQCIPEQNTEQIEKSFQSYFQLQIDMDTLCEEWGKKDPYFKQVNEKIKGMRILQQEPFECFLSFMVSQNNNIPRITQCLQAIRQKYGKLIHTHNKQQFYTFPTIQDLLNASEQDFRDLGLGYRAKYITATVKELNKKGGDQYLLDLRKSQNQQKIKESLLEFLGVGAKVADCISLFSMDCSGIVPVDTHVWQIYNKFYLKKSKFDKMGSGSYEKVNTFFKDKFGQYSGWAHSYLFAADLGVFQKEMNSNSKSNNSKKESNNLSAKKTQKTQKKLEDLEISDNEKDQKVNIKTDNNNKTNQKNTKKLKKK